MNHSFGSGSSYRPNLQQYAPSPPLRTQRPPRFGFQNIPLPYPRPRSSASKPNCNMGEGSSLGIYNPSHDRSQSQFSYGGNAMDTSSDSINSYISEEDASFVTCMDTSFSARPNMSFNADYADHYDESNNYLNDCSASNVYENTYSPTDNYSGQTGSNNFRNTSFRNPTRTPKFKKKMQHPTLLGNPGSTGASANIKKPMKRKISTFEPGHRCDLCAIDFTSRIPLEMHLRGTKHMKKIKAVETLKSLQSQGHAQVVNSTANAFRCEACNISLNGALQLQTHFDGVKHKNKIKELQCKMENILSIAEAGQQNGQGQTKVEATVSESAPGELSPSKVAKLSCDICGIIVNSHTQLLQHLGSKKHMAKVEGKPLPKKKSDKKQKEQNSASGEQVQSTEMEEQESGQNLSAGVKETVHGVPPLYANFVQKETLN